MVTNGGEIQKQANGMTFHHMKRRLFYAPIHVRKVHWAINFNHFLVGDIMETGTGPNPKNCPTGWLPFRTFCYKLHTVAKSYESARSACQQTPNTDLVSITDDYEFNFVRSLIYRNLDKSPIDNENVIEPAAWLGLTATRNGGNIFYQWVDQFPFAQRPFLGGRDFCTKIGSLNNCSNDEIHIILKRRNLEIGEHSSFYLENYVLLILVGHV